MQIDGFTWLSCAMYRFQGCADTIFVWLWLGGILHSSIIATSFITLQSVIYLPFQPKTCSPGTELIMWSNGIILCASHTFIFLVLAMGSDTSRCLDPQAHYSEVSNVFCIPGSQNFWS